MKILSPGAMHGWKKARIEAGSQSSMFGGIISAIAVLLASLSVACTPQLLPYEVPLETEGRIYLYLQALPQEVHRINFSITEASAIRQDGGVIPLRQSIRDLEGKQLIGRQKRLASATAPPGLYTGISIRIAAASLIGEEGEIALLAPEEPLLLEQEFTVVRKRASALFLSLDSADLVESGFRFTPGFSLARPRRQLINLLGFATNSASNVVSVFNKNTMEVVDAIATSSGPKGAILDQRRGWAYIALAGDDAIEAIDVTTGEILGRIRLNFGDEPVEIEISPDGRTLVSANFGSNTVSIIDASSLREVGRVSLPSRPRSVIAGRSAGRAYALQPLANAVSAIDLERRSLAVTRTLDEAPTRGDVGRDGNSLYVITRNSPNLLAIDPVSLIVTARIFVGAGAVSIKVDSKTGLIYVGKKTGEIVVIDPSLLTFIDSFRVKGSADFLTIDNDENALFVVLPESRMIQKVDLVSKRLLRTIDVEEGSYAVVVMGER
jgi:YVTN family beta-propeller protein